MKICVVNFGKGGWYVEGQKRIRSSLVEHGYQGDFMFYTDEKDLGCPPHKDMPYAFKPYAINKAVERGYEIVAWLDSAMYVAPCGRLEDFWANIQKDGYFLPLNGDTTGIWCADSALPTLGVTREEVMTMPQIMACVMGFDLRNDTTKEFLKQYYARSLDGSYRGAWRNENNCCSTDPRVKGHRHDQTAASVIAYKLGMRNLNVNKVSYQPDTQDPRIIFINHPTV